ncbi:MAG: uncharacterized protein QG619_90 [Pseudomonadota bacterium]|nr:uncharacterized protein [Pseudomonadota bacterium]MDQ5944673.1 uncharacterized protein [Pseudomonadota bacterium]
MKMNATVTDTKPWYREPWPWILMAGPAIVVVAGFVTAWLAVRSNDGLVEDDYYKQGLAVSQRMARDSEASGLGLSAEVVLGGEGRQVRLFLTAGEGVALPETVLFKVTHPTRSGSDQNAVLKRDGAGFYGGAVATALHGRWHVAVEDPARKWRLNGEWNVETQPALRLVAATVTTVEKGR